MLPKPPPRRPPIGFYDVHPYRIQGISIAGEQTFVMVPELDICFDIGAAPKAALPAKVVALSHGHMDHAAGIAYYYSQRHFQGMGVGKLVCHPHIEQSIHNVMQAWIDLEAQKTPYEVIALEPDAELEIKNHQYLRAFETVHTVPSLGYVVIEKRSKLREQFAGLPQEQLLAIKAKGEPITHIVEVPQVCYTGDTAWGPHFDRDDVLGARILITECTFLEPGHKSRAAVGKHLHLDHIVDLVERSKAEAIVLTHLSRRTHIGHARKQIEDALKPADRDRVLVLMDSRVGRARSERHPAETAAAASS